MKKRYLCPLHSEKTPSVAVYATHGWCFGCSSKVPLELLGMTPADAIREAEYVEDLEATLRYIDSLPKKEIRGFLLPSTDRGYYLLWPNRDYYKLRVEGAKDGQKYRGPSGHRKAPFVVQNSSGDTRLILVEGEFNALSLGALELNGTTIVSPGGAGDFYSRNSERRLQEYAQFSSIDIVVDNDAAGAIAAIECKARLSALGANASSIRVFFMEEKDFNEIYAEQGREGLRRHASGLGLL